jgi:acyl-homoserine-lactone acylase
MKEMLRVASRVLISMALLVSPAIAGSSSDPLTYNVEIVRDSFGVPHIHGKTDADTAYGLAYAVSEDNFATLQTLIATARGQQGLLTGKQGAVYDYGRQLLNIPATVERDYAGLPADVRAMLEAYAAGVNRYAQTHPKEVRNRKLFPVRGEDIAAGFALVSLQFYGIDEELSKLYSGKIPGTISAPERGSNGFAIAPKRMADGKAWLIANPHLPLEGPFSWYEAVVHSDEGLDMAGATLLGSPFIFVGHNRNLGWTVTLNRPDLVDVYKLTVNQQGDQYLYDGKWLDFAKEVVKLPVDAGLINVTATRSIIRSVHGPVIRNKQGYFAVRFAGMNQIRMLEQYYRLNKAQDWAQWQRAMDIGGIPSTNYVYADKTGRIAFVYNALFPDRKPGFDYAGILAGDTSANVWQGYLNFAQMPKVVDPASGFVFSANNSPFHAAGPGSDLRREDYSPLMGIEARMTNRAWRAEELLSESGVMTSEALLAIKFDTGRSRNSYAKTWIDKLLAVDTSDRPDLAEAQTLLKSWDWNSDGVGAADALAELAMIPANLANYGNAPLPDAKPLLEQYVVHMKTLYGRLDPPMDEIFSLRRGNVNLPHMAGVDTLRAVNWGHADRAKGHFKATGGDSFIMLVNWDKQGIVTSQSIMPYGSSARQTSPHYTDQMELFSQRRFKPVHFEWAVALAQGGKPYRP